MTQFDKESSHIFVYGKFRSIQGNYKDVIFAEAHLKAKKGNEAERMGQVQRLLDFKNQTQRFFANDFPIIIAGDFNDVPESDTIRTQMEKEFVDFYSMKDIDYPRQPYNLS